MINDRRQRRRPGGVNRPGTSELAWTLASFSETAVNGVCTDMVELRDHDHEACDDWAMAGFARRWCTFYRREGIGTQCS